jgi:hypothetical protein
MLVVGPDTFVLPSAKGGKKTTCAVPTQLFLIVKEQPARMRGQRSAHFPDQMKLVELIGIEPTTLAPSAPRSPN